MLLKIYILSVIVGFSHCAKILVIFPMAAPSHYILGSSLTRALAEKGHDVTMISPFSEKNPPKNGTYRDIVLTGFVEEHKQSIKDLNMFEMEKKNMFTLIPVFINMMITQTEKTLVHPNVQKLINSDEHFDVVIVEQFNNEAHKAFAARFNAPLIAFSTIGASAWINGLVGNPTPTSYVSDLMLGFSSKMTFDQRCLNSIMYTFTQTLNHLYIFPKQNELIQKHFNIDQQLDDIMYNVSLVLLNSHPSINSPVPYVPNMIDVGGFHIKPPKQLPKDLQEFLDGAKEGVVYFSLGSNVKSELMPEEKRKIFLDTFRKLKLKVLWKWEADELPDQPPNVHLAKWLPQQDVLAHPNVKLFITHGGLLSTLETVYHGKPALAIPIGGDQKMNAKVMVNQEFGLSLSFQSLTEADLTESIKDLLENPKYAKNARSRSEVFHDRLVDPLETAVYWVEYVIRNRGAPHLRVAGVDLPWYKYFLLDVIGVLLVVSLILFYVFCKVLKKVYGLCCKRRPDKLKRN